MKKAIQSLAKAALKSIYETIPDTMSQSIIKAASTLSGKPATEITFQQAIQILGTDYPDSDISKAANKVVNNVSERMNLNEISQDVIADLNEKADNGSLISDLETMAGIAIEHTKNDLAEDTECINLFKHPATNFFVNGEEISKLIAEELKKLILVEKTKQGKEKSKQAKSDGTLTSIGNTLLVITDREYQSAFTTSTKSKPGLYTRNDDGTKERQLALSTNFEVLRALAKAVLIDIESGKDPEKGTDIFFPAIAKELGIDYRSIDTDEQGNPLPRQDRTEARTAFVHKYISEAEKIWGVLPNKTKEYRFFAALEYNEETEVLHFVSPYINQLVSELRVKQKNKLNAGAKYYYWHSDLLYATAANERNKAAVEMAVRILQGVEQRGTTPDCKLEHNKKKHYASNDTPTITYSITLARLIDDCTLIRERLKSLDTTREKTQTLKRALAYMYRILISKTDLCKCFVDLEIKEISFPSMNRLSDSIVIVHKGKNPKYSAPVIVTNVTEEES